MKRFTFLLLMCLLATFGLLAQNVTLPFYQDFSTLSQGNTNTSGGSGAQASADVLDGIASVSNLYSAGGAARVGKSGQIGSLTTELIDASTAERLKISFKAVSWIGTSTPANGRVKITYGSQNNYIDIEPATHLWPITASDFKTYSVVFDAQSTPTAITFETQTGSSLDPRLFIDDLVVKEIVNPGILDEYFEGELFPPLYWSSLHLSGSVYWERFKVVINNDTNYCASVKFGTSAGNENWLITPKLAPESGQALSFSIRTPSYFSNTTVNVRVSTSSTDLHNFTDTLQSFVNLDNSTTKLTTTWTTHTIDLSSYVGQEIYVGFQVLDRNGLRVQLDSVTGVTMAPITCLATPAPNATDTTDTSLTLEWEVVNGATNWVLEYSTSPTFDSNVISQDISATPTATLTNLTQNTKYFVRLRTNCMGGDYSDWSPVVSFRTLCPPTVSTDWSETFIEADTDNGSSPFCWTRVINYSSSTTSYPYISSSGYDDNRSLYFYTNGNSHPVTIIATPRFAEPLSGTELSFWLKRESVSVASSFEVGVMSDITDTATFISIRDVTPTTTQWTGYRVKLENAPSTHSYIAFRFNANAAYPSYYLDKVELYAFYCETPTNVSISNTTDSSAVVSITDDASQNSWQYAITNDTTISNPATLTPVTITNNTYTLLGLTPNTDYRLWVRTNCTTGGESRWTELVQFKTQCEPVDSISEDFNSYSTSSPYYIPNCWTKITTHTIYPCVVAADPTNGLPSKSLKFQGSKPQYAILGKLSAPLNTFVLDFKLNREGPSSGKFQVGYMSNPTDTSTFVPMVTYNDESYKVLLDKKVYFSGVEDNGSNRYIAFRYGNVGATTTAVSWYYWIDDVRVTTPSTTCLPPSMVRPLSIGHDSVIIAYNLATASEGWEYALGSEADTDPYSLTAIFVTNDTITITELVENTTYKLWVRTLCGEGQYSEWTPEPIIFRTSCVPYSITNEDFESYTPVTSAPTVLPDCWRRITGSYLYPCVVAPSTTNGVSSNALRFHGTKPQFLAMQKSDVPLRELQLTFKLNKENALGGAFQVGYMSDPTDAETFVPVTTYNDVQYMTYIEKQVFFLNVPDNNGANRYIAFRYGDVGTTTQSISSSYWIDDISINETVECMPPMDIAYSFVGADSVIVYFSPLGSSAQWQYVIANHEADPDTLTPITITNDSILLSGLEENFTYRVWVRTDCGNGVYSSWQQTSFVLGYCTPAPTSNYGQGITNVRFGYYQMVNNATENEPGYYGDYSALVGDVPKGLDLNIDITYSTGYRYGTKIYVDWNQDYVFDNETELVYSGTSSSAIPTTLNASFTVPADMPNGNYRMRIVGSYNTSNINSCYSSYSGCAEDYTIQVIEPLTCMYPSAIVANNITYNSANITWIAGGTETSWDIVVSATELIVSQLDTMQANNVNTAEYQATGLLSNTTYYVYVRANCGGANGMSPWRQGTFRTSASDAVLPYYQDFSGATPEIATVSNSTNKWSIGSAVGNPGNSMYISKDNGASATYQGTITSAAAVVRLTFDNSPMFDISFDWMSNGERSATGFYDGMQVYVIPDTMELPESWTNSALTAQWLTGDGVYRLGGNFAEQNTWTTFVDTLPSTFANTTRKLVFMWKNDASFQNQPPASIDNIAVYGLYCDNPQNIYLDTVSTNSAVISWNSGSTEQSWILEYRKASDTNWTPVTVTDSTYAFSSLEASTSYIVRVKADCGTSGQYSGWANISFETECDAITIGNTQQIYNFTNVDDVLPDCWSRAIEYTHTNRDVYPRMETVSSNGKLIFKGYATQIAVTPRYTEPANTLEMRFDLIRQSTTNSGTLELGVMSNPSDSSTFIPIHDLTSLITVADGASQHFNLQMPSAPANNHYIAFRQIASAAQTSYYALDNVDIHIIPTCQYPSDIWVEQDDPTATSVKVVWSSIGTEQAWAVAHRQTSATEWIIDTVNTATATITNLTPVSNYEVKIKAICIIGSSDSYWSPIVTFSTPCSANTLPYSEDFSTSSSSVFPPNSCWNKYTHLFEDNIATSALTTGGSWVYNESPLGLTTAGKAKLNIYGSSIRSWLVTPPILLDSNSMLEFDMALTRWNSADPPTQVGDDDKFMVIISTDNGQTWLAANATVWSNDGLGDYVLSEVPNTVHRAYIDLSQYSGIVRIAFYGESQVTGNGDNDMHIDNILVHQVIVTPPSVETQPADNITENSAILHKEVTPGTYPITSEGFYYQPVGDTRWSQSLNGNITGLIGGTEYRFFAYAVANNVTFSGDTLTFTTEGTAAIHPTVTTLAATDITQTTATLHKSVVADVSEPVITEGWKFKKVSDVVWGTTSDAHIMNLSPNSEYEFYAYATTAINSNGYNGETLRFTTLSHTAPTVVTGNATNVQCNTATLTKTVTAGTETITEQGWYYRRTSATEWIKTTNATLTNLVQSTTYEYYAYAITDHHPMTVGETKTFNTPQCVGLDEVGYSVELYPNPANDIVTIVTEGFSAQTQVTIVDMAGKVVGRYTMAQGVNSIKVDVSAFAEGSYLVRIVSDSNVRTERLIIKK